MNDFSSKYIKELNYIKLSLENLIAMVEGEVDSKLEYYDLLENEDPAVIAIGMYPSANSLEELNDIVDNAKEHKEKYIKSRKIDDFKEIKTITRTISESLLVRQVSIVEKYLVDLSFDVYKECTKGMETVFTAPNFKIIDESSFSDCILAVDSINRNIKINIKETSFWKFFYKLRQLRHKLAHGERTIKLNSEALKDFNKILKLMVFEKSDHQSYNDHYCLIPTLSLQIEINEYFLKFISHVNEKVNLPLR